MSYITIANRKIGPNYPPYIIAEMSANHNGDINNAFAIIDMAKKCGADAVKLQTYKPETITLQANTPEFMINDGLWAGKSLFDLYQGAHMPWEWHKPLFDYAKKIGMTIFSSPFDHTAVDLLESLDAPAYKIASFEVVDIPLIERVAKTGKPMIISTGLANKEEILEAVNAAKNAGCVELAVLHCVSGYPAPPEDYNLRTLVDMQEQFGLVAGLSDHTLDNTTAIASVAIGGAIIEKHVTLDRNGGGPDDSFSLEQDGLLNLCATAKTVWQALGNVDYGLKSSEINNIQFRRSLYFVKELKKGDVITLDNIRSVRPGFGIPPKYLTTLLGKQVTKDIKKNTAADFSLINLN